MKVRVYLFDCYDENGATLSCQSEVYHVTKEGEFLVHISKYIGEMNSKHDLQNLNPCYRMATTGGFMTVKPNHSIEVIDKDGNKYRRTACDLIEE